jgi:hypothetical protein
MSEAVDTPLLLLLSSTDATDSGALASPRDSVSSHSGEMRDCHLKVRTSLQWGQFCVV